MNWRLGIASAAIAALAVLVSPPRARAETFYVAVDGKDTAAGTKDAPFASMAKAQERAAAGDTVYFRGGTYVYANTTDKDGVVLSKSGASGNRIHYVAYEGEVPVFDFSGLHVLDRITGLRVSGSWIHIKGLELKGVPQNINTQNESWGIYNLGDNNLYENLNIHHISGPGLFIGKGSHNLVLNCDSHHNYDPMSKAGPGENADGFGCHGTGTDNTISGCRAWWNTDDGYDFISATGVCVVENSWAFYNGYLPDTFTAQSNGNGFKAGGYGSGTVPQNPPRHTVRFCVAFRNRAAGFYANHHPIGGDWFNNSGYKNARDFDMLVLDPGGVPDHKLRNNLGYGSSSTIANWTGTDDASNSWTLGVSVSDADFQSVDFAGMDAPRKADGSLPDVAFLHLQPGSDLIDKGEDIGFDFNDAAPDLGAFESGAGTMPPTDAGMMASDGGAGTGSGGAPGNMAGSGGTSAGTGAGGSGSSGGGGGGKAASGAGSGGGAANGNANAGSGGTAAAMNMAGTTANDAAADSDNAGGCACRIARAQSQSRRAHAGLLVGFGIALATWRRRHKPERRIARGRVVS
jgi:hypothetical protein